MEIPLYFKVLADTISVYCCLTKIILHIVLFSVLVIKSLGTEQILLPGNHWGRYKTLSSPQPAFVHLQLHFDWAEHNWKTTTIPELTHWFDGFQMVLIDSENELLFHATCMEKHMLDKHTNQGYESYYWSHVWLKTTSSEFFILQICVKNDDN